MNSNTSTPATNNRPALSINDLTLIALFTAVIAVCAILSMVMMLKREVDYSVNEEQTIL